MKHGNVSVCVRACVCVSVFPMGGARRPIIWLSWLSGVTPAPSLGKRPFSQEGEQGANTGNAKPTLQCLV